MIERRFRDLWEQLQGKKPHLPHFLTEIRLEGIPRLRRPPGGVRLSGERHCRGQCHRQIHRAVRGRVRLQGAGGGVKDFVPSTLFPDYRPKLGGREDEKRVIVLEFDYSTPDGRRSMIWRRAKGWNRSFRGRKGPANRSGQSTSEPSAI